MLLLLFAMTGSLHTHLESPFGTVTLLSSRQFILKRRRDQEPLPHMLFQPI